MKTILLTLALTAAAAPAQQPVYGPELEGFEYPFPVKQFEFASQGLKLHMAFLDVAPEHPNGLYRGAAARQELHRGHLGTDHPGAGRRGIPGSGAGPDRLRQIRQAPSLPIQLPATTRANGGLNSALIYDMIYTQPVLYEFGRARTPTLLLIGQRDTTAIAKDTTPPEVAARLGHYPELGRAAARAIPRARLVEFPGLGHAPQTQDPAAFHAALLEGLKD